MQQEVIPRETVTRQQVLDYYRSKEDVLKQVPDDELLAHIGKANPTIIRHLVDAGDADASKFYPTEAQVDQTVEQRPNNIRRLVPGGKELMGGYAPGPQQPMAAIMAGRPQAPAASVAPSTMLAAPAAPAPKLGPPAPPQTGMGEVKLAERKPPAQAAPVGMGDVKAAEAGIKPPVAPAAVGMGDVKAAERPAPAPAPAPVAPPPAAPPAAPAAPPAAPVVQPQVASTAPAPMPVESKTEAPSTREQVVPADGWNKAPTPTFAGAAKDFVSGQKPQMGTPGPAAAPAAPPAAAADLNDPAFDSDMANARKARAAVGTSTDNMASLQASLTDPSQQRKPSWGRKIGAGVLAGAAGLLTANPMAGVGAYKLLAGAPERSRQHEVQGKMAAEKTRQEGLKQQGTMDNVLLDAGNAATGHKVTAADAAARLAETSRHNDQTDALGQSKLELARTKAIDALRLHGLDENGQPLPEDQLSAQVRAKIADEKNLAEYRAAGIELRRAELAAKKDPNNPQYKLALARFQQAQRRLDQTDRMLDIRQENNDAAIYGTDPNHQALPGALVTPDGRPVGSRFSNNVRPTMTERNRADLAKSGLEQAADMHDILDRHPEIFGPVEGRLTDVDTWLGSQSADAAQFSAALETLSDHLAATFGNSSLPAIEGLKEALGRFKTNPEALAAALTQVEKSAKTIQQQGIMNTVGTPAGAARLAAPAPKQVPPTIAAPPGPTPGVRRYDPATKTLK